MKRNTIARPLPSQFRKQVIDLCYRLSSSRQIVAICIFGSWAYGYADKTVDLNVLLVVNNFPLLLKGSSKSVRGVKTRVLQVDRRTFEKDVTNGQFGEFLAGTITDPYEPLVNQVYLKRQEVRVKKRLILELLESLVLDFPELSYELAIRVEYFMYEVMLRRARLFPLVVYSFLNMLRNDHKRKNVNAVLNGYVEALKQLAKESQILFFNEYVKIASSYIVDTKKQKSKFSHLLRSIQRTVTLHLLSVLPNTIRSLKQNRQIFLSSYHGDARANDPLVHLEDPLKYLLMPTTLGLVTFSEKSTITDFIRRTPIAKKGYAVHIEKVGGVLNDVYILTSRKHPQEKVIVKRFRDWSGVKWFALALWAIGTKTFAVSGKSRLEREYSITQFLSSHKLPVPRILHVSAHNRLLFKEFIEGENLVQILKRILLNKETAMTEIAIVKKVGRILAKSHRLGVVIGDCKPENIVVTQTGEPFFVDLEQAERGQNQAWDIAEFLYYTGHYVPPISSGEAVKIIAKNFVAGYLEVGGNEKTVMEARSPRYVKVFSVFTPPQMILAISEVCALHKT